MAGFENIPKVFAGHDVCEDLETIVNDKLFHDVVFRVDDKYVNVNTWYQNDSHPYCREIYGHKFVLCSASPSIERLILEHQPLSKYFTSKW